MPKLKFYGVNFRCPECGADDIMKFAVMRNLPFQEPSDAATYEDAVEYMYNFLVPDVEEEERKERDGYRR